MKNGKIFAFAVALMMFAAGGMIVFQGTDSEAASGNGQFTVYVNTNGTWLNDVVVADDAAQAIMGSDFWTAGDSMVPLYTMSGGYVSLNQDTYGAIQTLSGLTDDDDEETYWSVFVYQGSNWVLANEPLGYYKCFDDYSSVWQTANIALYYGDEQASVPASLTSSMANMSQIVAVDNNPNFVNYFYIKVSYGGVTPLITQPFNDVNGNPVTTADLAAGVLVKGYGSDAYIALAKAVGINFSGEPGVPANGYYGYGWMYSLFNLTTQQIGGTATPHDWTDDTYAYWVIYDTYHYWTGEIDHVSDFNLGLIGEAGSAIADNTIALIYEYYSMN